ncbi:MAG: hypothetical protein WAW67_03920 [Candidatus Omnitrophota bacterium]
MKENTRNKLRKIRDEYYVPTKAKYNKGNSLIDDVWNIINRVVIIGLGIELFNQNSPWKIPISIAPIIAIIYPFLATFLGYIDQHILHLTQAENKYQFDFLNPFMKKIARQINQIKKELWQKK